MKHFQSALGFIHKEKVKGKDMDDDSNIMNRLRNLFTKEHEDEDIAEEIISILDENSDEGENVDSEAEMIRNIFRFKEKDAKDIMTHRKNIIALDGEETLEEALQFIVNEGNSRFPVYLENIDNIIGIIHLRDAVKCYFHEELRQKPLKELDEMIMKAFFVPETRDIDRLFRQMKTGKIHMVIVIDEYGQTSGIVAMEDILEEIVGDILDEHDEEEKNIIKTTNGSYIVNGMTELDELSDILEISFTNEFETLNGFLIDCLDHIPQDGETCNIEYEGYMFHVISAEDNMIQKVRIEKLDKKC